ncbi:hypothetical protein [Sinomicrobium sp. M5D2P17]
MKKEKEQKKLSLKKTKISAIQNPYAIKGGNESDDDDWTGRTTQRGGN